MTVNATDSASISGQGTGLFSHSPLERGLAALSISKPLNSKSPTLELFQPTVLEPPPLGVSMSSLATGSGWKTVA